MSAQQKDTRLVDLYAIDPRSYQLPQKERAAENLAEFAHERSVGQGFTRST